MSDNTKMIKDMQRDMLKMATEWSIMKNQWEDMRDKQEIQGVKLDRIINILENDDATGSKGLVSDVRENNMFRQTAMTKIKMIAVIGSTVVSAVVAILTKYFLR